MYISGYHSTEYNYRACETLVIPTYASILPSSISMFCKLQTSKLGPRMPFFHLFMFTVELISIGGDVMLYITQKLLSTSSHPFLKSYHTCSQNQGQIIPTIPMGHTYIHRATFQYRQELGWLDMEIFLWWYTRRLAKS